MSCVSEGSGNDLFACREEFGCMESNKCKGSEPQMKRNLKGCANVNQPWKGSYSDSTSSQQWVSEHGSQSSNVILLGTAKVMICHVL